MTDSDLRGRTLWDFVFDSERKRPHAEALHDYKKRPGWFPTMKAPSGIHILRTRDNIVHDFLYFAETDFDVVSIVDHPLETLYWVEGRRGRRTESHIADLALGHRDGSITFIDVRRYWETMTTPGERGRADARVQHYREQFGSVYILHDERKIYPEPLFTNVKEMCELARPQARLRKFERIREDILRMPLPMTVHQIMQASTFNAMSTRFEDESPETASILTEINPVFEVVMDLVASGDLWVDEAQPFAIESEIHRTEFTGIRRDRNFVRSFLARNGRTGEERREHHRLLLPL